MLKPELKISPNGLTIEKVKAYAEAFPEAGSAALNRMAQQSRTQANRLVRERYNVKAGVLNSALTTERSTKTTLRSKVKAKGRRIPLVEFGARGRIPSSKRSVGVSVEVVRGRRLTSAGTFLAIPTFGRNTGAKGVYMRWGKTQYPIRRLYGPSVPQMFTATAVYRKLIEFVHERLPKLVYDAVKFKRK